MVIFRLSDDVFRKMEYLYSRKVITSKISFVRLGLAIGLKTRRRSQLVRPRKFTMSLFSVDKHHIFGLICAWMEHDVVTEEEMAATLEEFADAGLRQLLDIMERTTTDTTTDTNATNDPGAAFSFDLEQIYDTYVAMDAS